MRLSVKQDTRGQRESEPGPERFISSLLEKKKPQSDKWLRLLSNGESKTDPNQLFAFPQKICKNVRLISNDGKHMRNIENGVDSLQLFSFTQEAGIRIALHASKYRANVKVVLKYLVVSRSRYQRNGC